MANHKYRSNPQNNSPFNQQYYFGIVEDNADPETLGRVRVRVFGIHAPKDEKDDWRDIPTEDLPWATVMMPVTNASSGIGRSATGITPGTQVMLIFRDSNFQAPLILGVIPNKNADRPNPTHGFCDPSGEYPKTDWLGRSDMAIQAIGKDLQKTEMTAHAYNSIDNAPIAGPSKDKVKIEIVGGA